jgi:hypothetical protein
MLDIVLTSLARLTSLDKTFLSTWSRGALQISDKENKQHEELSIVLTNVLKLLHV